MRKLFFLFALIFTGSVHAATFLQYTTPFATVSADETIEMWATLTTDMQFNLDTTDFSDMTLGGAIDPLDFPIGGFSPDANMGQGGFVEFDQIFSVGPSRFLSCGGSFVTDSGGNCALDNENYSFDFGTPSWAPTGMLSLAPGESLDILIGTFTPVAGGATPGVYDLLNSGIGVSVSGVGFDDFGEEVFVNAFITLSEACPTGDASCAFVREVNAQVPLPGAMVLMLSAFLGLAGFGKRNSKR